MLQRLQKCIAQSGLCSRRAAEAMIEAGRVTVNGEVILDGNIREACKGHNIAPDGGKSNPYTVDHQNHPGLFNKDGYVSFCGHGPGVRFRNVRILDLSKHKGK